MNEKHINKSPIFCKSDSTKRPLPCEIESQVSPLPCGGGLGVGKIGYKQTSIGIIPQDWEVVRLGEVGDIVGGGTPDTTNPAFWNGEIAWISSSDIDEESIYRISTRRFINEFAIKNSATNLIPAKSVLIISRVGVGKVAVNENPLCTSQDTQSLIPKNDNYIFMAYLVKFNIKKLLQYNQGTSIKGFTKAELKSLQIPLPPLKEQEKIAQILGVWDSAIDSLANLIKAKRKYKTALMQRLLTPPKDKKSTHPLAPSAREGEREVSHHTNEGEVEKAPPLAGGVWGGVSTITNEECVESPRVNEVELHQSSLRFAGFSDKWQEFRLGDIGEIYQPQTIPQSDFTEMGYNVYGANGIIGKYHSYNHEKAQIAIACRGNSCGAVNFTIPKSWITGNAMVINLDNSKVVNKIFAYYTLLNSNLNYLITGSGQPQITGNIKNHKIKLPTLAEQKKIAQVLSACDKEIETLNLKFECLKAQKRGLMQQLLSGKVRVKI